ncbi:MAG: bi-domain-containing oxidoreductase [Proteobacteria bacterium]|nr:bi-domain-containing oxidoreductase [Pseudomonadota bacterium]
MKQILQNLNNGQTILEDVPCPSVKPGHLLIRTSVSLVSTGTEKMLVDFGKANLIDKARQQPDKVKMVLDKVKTDGLMPTFEAVRGKLDQPLPMGYCNVGTVIAVGSGVDGFSIGDRVASNGKHAEVVCVPKNLCARIPGEVSDEAATFTVIGSIALQGIRLVRPTLGETIVVTGLGLIGLVTVQLFRANGCRVLGIDFDEKRVDLARSFGAETVNLSRGEDPVAVAQVFSRGQGIDAVIITASTKSSEPVHQAALMCRKRGRIVLVGVIGLELSRADFYEKELSFQVSCSYGPGRYDPLYEEGGQDYPFGFVRWTEQHNFEAVIDMLDERRINVEPLVSNRFPLAQAEEAYKLVEGGKALGIVLSYPSVSEYPENELTKRTISLATWETNAYAAPGAPVVGFIGSGNYATGVLIPAFTKTQARLKSVASNAGVSGVHAGKKYGFEETTTDTGSIIESSDINTVIITTRHDSHARFVCEALKAGKHVFVEKPLCLTESELNEIIAVYSKLKTQNSKLPLLMVGFNRRFAPQVLKIKDLLQGVREPKSFVMTINAGSIPPEHWTQDRKVGGGRIIGEGCHFIDLLRYLAGAPIVGVQALMMGNAPGIVVRDDKVTFTLTFADGSFGTVHYLANGHKSFPKERLEVFCAGRILQLDNFRKLHGFGWPGFRKMNLWRQDKGQVACAAAFVNAVAAGISSPITLEELVEVTKASFDIVKMMEH